MRTFYDELMKIKKLVETWFAKWEEGDFENLPISTSFIHISPFGTIRGKEVYLNQVRKNKDKFLGYTFEIGDAIYEDHRACVQYKAIQEDFSLDVSEWHYSSGGLIEKIIAYYHIGEIREERKLSVPEND